MSTDNPNPFGVRDVDDRDANVSVVLAEIEQVGGQPGDPWRMLVRRQNGRLALFDCVAHGATRQIGPDVSFAEARDLATAVLGGNQLAITDPRTVHALSLCYIAALAAAERRKSAIEGAVHAAA